MTKITRVDEAIARERVLRSQIEDVQRMTDAVDAARVRLESGLDGLNYSSEEIKGQIRILKERQAWLIGQQDRLRKEIGDVKT